MGHPVGKGGKKKQARPHAATAGAAAAGPAPSRRTLVGAPRGQPRAPTATDRAAKLRTEFNPESRAAVEERKADATRPLAYAPLVGGLPRCSLRDAGWGDRDSDAADGGDGGERFTQLGLPKRPAWDYRTPPAELEARERAAFEAWLAALYGRYDRARLNFFEHNLEVWRQLWRVLERCHVACLLADARFPLMHFSAALYRHITDDLRKPVVLLLTKADLVPPASVAAWIDWLTARFPGLTVAAVDCPRPKKGWAGYRRAAAARAAVLGALGGCHVVVDASRNGGRPEALAGYMTSLAAVDHGLESVEDEGGGVPEAAAVASASEAVLMGGGGAQPGTHESGSGELGSGGSGSGGGAQGGYAVVAMVGAPNVGKSSLVNALFGRKVVSSSPTPGHTKHFQTLFLGPQLVLCDSPGVVFPKLDVPAGLQVLFGEYPVAQCREPYSAVRFLAERCRPRCDVVYGLQPPEDGGTHEGGAAHEGDDGEGDGRPRPVRGKGSGGGGPGGSLAISRRRRAASHPWSPWSLCESLALKAGWVTARGGRPDCPRAANRILRDALAGDKLRIAFLPPDGDVGGDGVMGEGDGGGGGGEEGMGGSEEGGEGDGEFDEEEGDEGDEEGEEEGEGGEGGSPRPGARGGNAFALLADDVGD